MQTLNRRPFDESSSAVFAAALLAVLLGFGVFFDYLASEDALPGDLAGEAMCLQPNENGLGEPSAKCEQLAQAGFRP